VQCLQEEGADKEVELDEEKKVTAEQSRLTINAIQVLIAIITTVRFIITVKATVIVKMMLLTLTGLGSEDKRSNTGKRSEVIVKEKCRAHLGALPLDPSDCTHLLPDGE
jgi:hypothetical protein